VKPILAPVPTRRSRAAPAPANREPSDLVAALQTALIATGDFDGEIDGLIGPVTRAAIMKYQKRQGFEQTGKASRLLLASIEQDLPMTSRGSDQLSSIISKSDTAEKTQRFDDALVRQIQTGLANDGLEISVDGIYGSKTRAAIAEFQQRHNLDVTGKPDRAVLETLKRVGALNQG